MTDRRADIVGAYLRVMAAHPYAEVSMAMVAEAAGMSLGDLRRAYDSEEALREGVAGWADAAMLDRVAQMPRSIGVRDRVIDAMLARFHVLLPHRDAVRSLLTGAAGDPAALLFFARVSVEEHRWTLIAAGLDHRGARARTLAEAVSQTFVAAAPTWLEDDDADLGPTRGAIAGALPYDEVALAAFSFPIIQGHDR